ncbi:hypothetical protein L1987_61933 [Smallanthus sonchifolius]|uniref:Uncharacterized protein n=1 Tax=Smallanthus sonchifolius TaxID=185202 RepID=A0ACB9C8Y9_9ASTR|nr:hypothetical protein L1987_61933 [Smallanthus sonchifolius]
MNLTLVSNTFSVKLGFSASTSHYKIPFHHHLLLRATCSSSKPHNHHGFYQVGVGLDSCVVFATICDYPLKRRYSRV